MAIPYLPYVPKREINLAIPPKTPRFVRLPKEKTLCPYSQLSRGKIRELIEPRPGRPIPPVESFVLPNLGKGQKGVRMVVLSSLMSYLEQAAEKARLERPVVVAEGLGKEGHS